MANRFLTAIELVLRTAKRGQFRVALSCVPNAVALSQGEVLGLTASPGSCFPWRWIFGSVAQHGTALRDIVVAERAMAEALRALAERIR